MHRGLPPCSKRAACLAQLRSSDDRTLRAKRLTESRAHWSRSPRVSKQVLVKSRGTTQRRPSPPSSGCYVLRNRRAGRGFRVPKPLRCRASGSPGVRWGEGIGADGRELGDSRVGGDRRPDGVSTPCGPHGRGRARSGRLRGRGGHGRGAGVAQLLVADDPQLAQHRQVVDQHPHLGHLAAGHPREHPHLPRHGSPRVRRT
jgi:hypothetical protein